LPLPVSPYHCMALMRMACAMLDAVTTIRYSPTEATLMGR
jgi:hypothetical protein